MKRLVIAFGVIVALLLPSTAMAGHDRTLDNYAPTGHKAYVCHRTSGIASSGNGYNFITVDEHSLDAHLGDARSGPANQHPARNNNFFGWLQDFVPNQWQINNRTCADKPPPPPKRPDYDPNISLMVCGDPRLLLELENESDFRVQYRISVRKSRLGRTILFRNVAADTDRTLWPIWIKGQSYIRITAYPHPSLKFPALAGWSFPTQVLYNGKAPRTTPWGQGGCPVNLGAAKVR